MRPDLTDYAEMVSEMRRVLNIDSLTRLSATDIVKMCIERGFENVTGKKPASKKRKRFVRLGF